MMKLNNITTLKDLNAFRASLKQFYDLGGKEMINSIKSKANAPFNLLKNNKERAAASGKIGTLTLSPILEQIAMGLVGLVLPRKMGSVAKWVIAFAAKKAIKAVIKKKLAPKVVK